MPSSVATGWAREALAALERDGLLRQLEPLESPQGPVVTIAGVPLVNFSSNDYLGLAADKRVTDAASRAVELHGLGAGASRLVVGDFTAHQALEKELAAFMETESALLFGTGYQANVGTLSALCGEGDVIFSDALNHASLIDGCRLSRAKVVVYPHSDVEALARLMDEHPGRRRLIVTDAVFSMDGDLAPVRALDALAKARGAALLVDEAHSVGVLGPRGAGLCAAQQVRPDVRIGTLGKALGTFGAYAATSAPVRALLIHKARSLVFSTALPPAVCVAASRALALLQDESIRARLWRNIERFAAGARELGWNVETRSAIFPLVVGEPRRAVDLAAELRRRGILAKPIRPPTVPVGTSRLRFALSAAHHDAHVELALAALAAVRKES